MIRRKIHNDNMNIEGENNKFPQCFSANHAVLRSKWKVWLAQNQNNLSE